MKQSVMPVTVFEITTSIRCGSETSVIIEIQVLTDTLHIERVSKLNLKIRQSSRSQVTILSSPVNIIFKACSVIPSAVYS